MAAVWIGFNVFVLAMLMLDLYVFHKVLHIVKHKEALVWSAVWVSLALLFAGGIYLFQGSESGVAFLTGYLIELSLSVDNLFVFLVLFSYFKTPKHYLHKVLFWGVLGALIMRATFIFAGIALLNHFHWITYVFGAFLVVTGIQFARGKGEEVHPEANFMLRLIRHWFKVTPDYVDGLFFLKKEGRYWATPLFIVLAAIEVTDIMFAIDSVPAVLAITQDPFIAYSSNVFAILGLRTLYFAIEGLISLFHYLQYGLALLLIFIGMKMIAADYFVIPNWMVLGIIVGILAVFIAASVVYPQQEK